MIKFIFNLRHRSQGLLTWRCMRLDSHFTKGLVSRFKCTVGSSLWVLISFILLSWHIRKCFNRTVIEPRAVWYFYHSRCRRTRHSQLWSVVLTKHQLVHLSQNSLVADEQFEKILTVDRCEFFDANFSLGKFSQLINHSSWLLLICLFTNRTVLF